MISQKKLSPDSQTAQTAQNDQSDQCFTISLSPENPFEGQLLKLLCSRTPVQVGRLRYALGDSLLSELLIRGADSLEAEYPGSMGLQDLIQKCEESGAIENAACHKPSSMPEPEMIESDSVLQDNLGKTVHTAQKSDDDNPSKAGDLSEKPQSIPKINVSGFDFGSKPVQASNLG